MIPVPCRWSSNINATFTAITGVTFGSVGLVVALVLSTLITPGNKRSLRRRLQALSDDPRGCWTGISVQAVVLALIAHGGGHGSSARPFWSPSRTTNSLPSGSCPG